MLYLVATPIGHLGDFSFRARDILSEVDYILCEDTRRSGILMKHYEIKTPLKSYHKFSESKREKEVLTMLKEGQPLALISDAGTPGICDPGERLTQKCLEEGIPVIPIPGPCALVHALIGSGLPATPFQFVGFLPKKQGELQSSMLDILCYEGTTICYESPHRLQKVIELICRLDPERNLVVARELTKKFEEFHRGTAKALSAINEWKGETILLIGQGSQDFWNTLTLEEHLELIQNSFQISQKEAIKILAKIRPISKKELYKKFMTTNQKHP